MEALIQSVITIRQLSPTKFCDRDQVGDKLVIKKAMVVSLMLQTEIMKELTMYTLDTSFVSTEPWTMDLLSTLIPRKNFSGFFLAII